MLKINLSLSSKIIIAFVLVLLPFFFLIEYTASRILENQVVENINGTLRVYTINDGKDLDKLF